MAESMMLLPWQKNIKITFPLKSSYRKLRGAKYIVSISLKALIETLFNFYGNKFD